MYEPKRASGLNFQITRVYRNPLRSVMNPKFFTVEEANAIVGFLEGTLERIRLNKRLYLWLNEELEILKLIVGCGAEEANPDSELLKEKTAKFEAVARNIQKDITAIHDSGCVLRDIDAGLVDFYSIQDGTVVFLCWQKGEDSLQYFHSIRSGFKGRQPLMGQQQDLR